MVAKTAGLEGMKGNKGNGGFDADEVGGVGSERECILDVGDPATRRGDTEVGLLTGEFRSCGDVFKAVGRGGIGGGSTRECWPYEKQDTGDPIDDAGVELWLKGGMGGTGSSRVLLRPCWERESACGSESEESECVEKTPCGYVECCAAD